MVFGDRKRDRPNHDAGSGSYDGRPRSSVLPESRDDWVITLAGIAISVGVFYDVFLRQAQ
jgi:hypothetical protein